MKTRRSISLFVLSLIVALSLTPASAFAAAPTTVASDASETVSSASAIALPMTLATQSTTTGSITTQATKSYRVVFKANGGTGSMSAQAITRDKTATLKANSYKRSGYTFKGWNTKANGKGKTYKNKAKVNNLAAAGKTVTLYSQWTKASVSKSASQKARSAYKSYLTKYSGIKNFRVVNLGGNVPALLVNASFYSSDFPQHGGLVNSIGKILIYKNGTVKKIGSMVVPGGWDSIHYANHRLYYGPHNHWFDSFRVTANQSRYEVSTELYYESSMPLYRGYNTAYAKYCVNGKVKYEGKAAIDGHFTEVGKCKTNGNTNLKFYANTSTNRNKYI